MSATLTAYYTVGERILAYCAEEELPHLRLNNTTFQVDPIKDIRLLRLELGLH